ncbi:hypothetical protein PG985_008805 [Apiospora marii]|uniref:YDG domain-containing protein n=1 Tax=Apiospora marii TaxID=335849 RepID=A0ABR1R4A1_9PEZI
MVNQLKRKRSGSPEAFAKRQLDGGEKGRPSTEQRIRGVAHQAEHPAGTENVLAATQPAAVGTASVTANDPEEAGNAISATDDHNDTEKVAGNDSDTEDVLEILDIPTPQHDPTYFDCIKGMQKEHIGIKNFAVKSKRKKQVPTSDPEDVRRLARLTPYLNFLEFRLEMNHRIFKESKVAATLALMNVPGFHFPADVAERAARLVAKWEEEDWSEDRAEADDQSTGPPQPQPQQASAPSSRGATSNNANEEAPAVQISIPGARDPLFGTNGIMHGVISTRNAVGRRVYMLNPRLPHQSSKVFGHNGLSVGQWFAMRFVALHHGAHGASQAGIHGSQATGAYSIVAGNSLYHEFDQDKGVIMYYSAPRAHENKDPHQLGPASSGSLALRASHASRKPVRVLRAAGGGQNQWLPRCGLRYDGLYEVAAIREKKNASGGLYEQFKLVRLGPNINGHEELKDIAKDSPSAEQAAAYRNLMDRD